MELLAHLQHACGNKPPDGVHLAPALDPKKLANALKWAPFGSETPLVLIDDSVWSSGKAGALVTSHALYCDDPRVRIELHELQYPPSYPEGANESPRVWTPRGEVKLKRMTLEDVQAAWTRVLSAIVQANRGQGVPTNTAGTIGELAKQFLAHKDISLAPHLPSTKLHNAAAHFPDWLDYATGEQVVAYIDETALGAGDEGIALTDRRLIARIGDKNAIVPYTALVGVDAAKGFMEKKLGIAAGQHSTQLPLITAADAIDSLVTFLRKVMELPHEHRWAPLPPPESASALASQLVAPDPRVPILLRCIHEATSRGMSWELARDFVTRVNIMHQTLSYGRGASQGWKISPLYVEDLMFLLTGVFGAPLSLGGDAATRVMDFAIGRSGVVGAAASTAVGLAMLAVVGVGWVSTPKKTIQGVRMSLRELPSSTGFLAYGARGNQMLPLQDVEPKVLGWVNDALDDLEALTLLERILFGWQTPASQLFAIDPNTIAQHAQALIGPVDLSAFFRK